MYGRASGRTSPTPVSGTGVARRAARALASAVSAWPGPSPVPRAACASSTSCRASASCPSARCARARSSAASPASALRRGSRATRLATAKASLARDSAVTASSSASRSRADRRSTRSRPGAVVLRRIVEPRERARPRCDRGAGDRRRRAAARRGACVVSMSMRAKLRGFDCRKPSAASSRRADASGWPSAQQRPGGQQVGQRRLQRVAGRDVGGALGLGEAQGLGRRCPAAARRTRRCCACASWRHGEHAAIEPRQQLAVDAGPPPRPRPSDSGCRRCC